MITSNQNARLKLTRALLGRAKERIEANAFAAEGVRLVEEALAAGWKFRFALFGGELNPRAERLVRSLQQQDIETEEVAAHLLNAMSDTGNTQGVLAVLELPAAPALPTHPDFVLIPDQLRDPGNLGTLLRSAAAAGVQLVLLPPETTDAFAPKVVRAGMGAHFRLPMRSMSWEEIRQATGGTQVLLADMEGTSCWEMDLTKPLTLIVGGEAEGASPEARKLATGAIRIPMPGGSESLNAGVAGSVLLFEVVRQKTSPQMNSDELRYPTGRM
jgi:TrmH family RNA methyltransferase